MRVPRELSRQVAREFYMGVAFNGAVTWTWWWLAWNETASKTFSFDVTRDSETPERRGEIQGTKEGRRETSLLEVSGPIKSRLLLLTIISFRDTFTGNSPHTGLASAEKRIPGTMEIRRKRFNGSLKALRAFFMRLLRLGDPHARTTGHRRIKRIERDFCSKKKEIGLPAIFCRYLYSLLPRMQRIDKIMEMRRNF